MTRPTVIIVGGGISGLVSAWALRDVADVTVIESTDRLGGKIETTSFRSHPLDLGPDAFIVRNRAGVELCAELGLDAELIEPNSKSAAIYARGHLRAFPDELVFGIPTGVGALYRSHIVSVWGVLRVLRDRFSRVPLVSYSLAEEVRAGRADPSVGEIFTKRFGAMIVSSLIDPLVGGINASDVGALSFSSSMPLIFDRIVGQPSVMRALRGREEQQATASGSIFRGLKDGMSTLIVTLVDALKRSGTRIVFDEPVLALSRGPSGAYVLDCRSGPRMADAVILATPAYVSADLVRQFSRELAEELDSISYASVATATFAWNLRDVPGKIARDLRQLRDKHTAADAKVSSRSLLPGSGVLVARDAKMLTTATSFTSTKWPRSARDDEVVVRVSVGRHHDERIVAMSDDALTAVIKQEIALVLGITAEPLEVVIKRWPKSFPQYDSGHAERIRRVDAIADELGIGLVGAAYHGIGIPSCIEQARLVAQHLADQFDSRKDELGDDRP